MQDSVRNANIYNSQNNKNPFIDHPELIERIASVTCTNAGTQAGALHIAGDSLYYGSVSQGADQDGLLVVSNQGNDDLTLSNLAISDPEFALQGSPNLVIPADSARTFTIRFTPSMNNTV